MKRSAGMLLIAAVGFFLLAACMKGNIPGAERATSSESAEAAQSEADTPPFYTLPANPFSNIPEERVPLAYRALNAREKIYYRLIHEMRLGHVSSGYFNMEYNGKEVTNAVIAHTIDFYADEPYIRGGNLSRSDAYIKFEADSRNNLGDMLQLQRQAADRIMENLPSNADDYEKILYIATVLSAHVEWDQEAADRINRGDYPQQEKDPLLWQSYFAYGALVNGKAGCTGYTRAFMYLCDMVDIRAIAVMGTTHNQGETATHVWNKVFIDGDWYVVDLTWFDVDQTNSLEWRFFLVSDQSIRKTHTEEQSHEARLGFRGDSFPYTYPPAQFDYERTAPDAEETH